MRLAMTRSRMVRSSALMVLPRSCPPSPLSKQHAALAGGVGTAGDCLLADRGAQPAMPRPFGDALFELPPERRVRRRAAEVLLLHGIVHQIEELRREAIIADIFPAPGANHDGTRLIGLATEDEPRAAPGIIELAEGGVAPIGWRRAAQERQQRATFEPLMTGRATEQVEEGRQQVDRFDERRDLGAARAIGGRIRVADDQGDAGALLMEQLLLAQPMIAEIVAVIAGEQDERVREPPLPLEKTHQPADMI